MKLITDLFDLIRSFNVPALYIETPDALNIKFRLILEKRYLTGKILSSDEFVNVFSENNGIGETTAFDIVYALTDDLDNGYVVSGIFGPKTEILYLEIYKNNDIVFVSSPLEYLDEIMAAFKPMSVNTLSKDIFITETEMFDKLDPTIMKLSDMVDDFIPFKYILNSIYPHNKAIDIYIKEQPFGIGSGRPRSQNLYYIKRLV